MCGHNDTVKIIILNIATINRDVKMLQLYRISLVFFIRYITCLCIVNTMYHYISTVQADLALSKSFTFLFSTLKNTAACQPEIRIGHAWVKYVDSYICSFVSCTPVALLTRCMTCRKQRQVREIKQCGPPRA